MLLWPSSQLNYFCTVLGIFQPSSTITGIVLVLRKLKPRTDLATLAEVILKL